MHDYGIYMIQVIDADGHIAHWHTYEGFREEAEQNAKRSSRHWIGGPYTWNIDLIKEGR